MTNRSLLLTGIKRLGYVFGARSLASASRASSASSLGNERAGDAKRKGIQEVMKSRELSPLHALQRNSFSHSELRSIARSFFNSKRYLHALQTCLTINCYLTVLGRQLRMKRIVSEFSLRNNGTELLLFQQLALERTWRRDSF
ncbi:hypothetical protein PIB30_067365 [Stylosanthes scabra]|uniref:Pentatricopeptide repeat-containing protein n=1 Tax=Stylosanthes scabra TaxID=79078 RepID=A0ABU6TNA7_9FABA|nr:hypothetical protein [Stylosanthes scabra]